MTQDEVNDLMVRTDARVDIIYTTLLGNGHAGKLETIEDRLRNLEEAKNQMSGVMKFLAWVVSATGIAEIVHWLMGKHS